MAKNKLSSLSIFMPAFNEESNIAATIIDATKAARLLTNDYEVIIVDDGSTDKTAEIVQEFGKRNKHVRLVKHKRNKGYGGAIKTGLRSVRKDWIFFTDSDGQFRFDELGKFVSNKDKADLIIGYRRKRRDPLHRIILAQVLLKLWNRIFFGLKVKDVDCAYKFFPREISDQITLKTESAITVTEFLVRAKKFGYSFYQVPVTHYYRKHGTQTGGNIRVILRAVRESFRLFTELKAS